MKILLVFTKLNEGGIETLIVRMANWLVCHEHNVTVLLQEEGTLCKLLDQRVDIQILNKRLGRLLFDLKKQNLRFLDKKKYDYIYSYGPTACYLASFLYKYGFNSVKPKFINGIYHPYQFALQGRFKSLDRMHMDLYKNYINDHSKIFMSEVVRAGNESLLGCKYPESYIWPLSIDDSLYKNIKREVIPYRIVSVGRYVDFKTYNLYMIDIVNELLKLGYDVTWQVYGYGPLREDMKLRVKEHNLQDRIFINDKLPYERFSDVMSKACIFVGMGTSMLEAALCRVPCVTTIAYDNETMTYGGIYELPYYSCGEKLGDEYRTIPVIEEIKRIFEMDDENYKKESERSFEYIQPYLIDNVMNDFVDYVKSVPEHQGIANYAIYKYFIYSLVDLFLETRKRLKIKTSIKKVFSTIFKLSNKRITSP
jgi:glycosyltransferase involved in cell wall biosynthesis